MIITGITREQFSDAVAKAGTLYADNLVPSFGTDYSPTRFSARVILRQTGYGMGLPNPELAPAQRRSASAFDTHRRINAVCWHGYRDALREVFAINPETRVYTMFAKYKGQAEFERLYPHTAHRNIGAPVRPVTMPELCDCPIGLRWESVLA
jgi:hypothetical protein